MTTTPDTRARMRSIQESDGTRAMLVYLNGLTDHRYTALYRFDDERLRNVYFFDRERADVTACPEIPVMASYRVFVRSGWQTFTTPDSLDDERVAGHPKRMGVRSYCGVPLIDESGRMFGTICHFDHRPLPISEGNVALMEAVAGLLKGELKRFGPGTST